MNEWITVLPRALVAGFVKTDKDFQEQGIDEQLVLTISAKAYRLAVIGVSGIFS